MNLRLSLKNEEKFFQKRTVSKEKFSMVLITIFNYFKIYVDKKSISGFRADTLF